jgi:hypothetical protein
MQDTNKALTALVRSMKRALKNQHGVDVPHAALRACLLQAQGESPHAFAAKQPRPAVGTPRSDQLENLRVSMRQDRTPAYGDALKLCRTLETELAQLAGQPSDAKLRSLVEEAPHYFHPGYDFDGKKLEWLQRAGLVSADAPREGDADKARALFIVYDDQNMASALALDSEGRVLVPEDFCFPEDCLVLSLHAEVPKVSRYGLPDYYANPSEFFGRHDLRVSSSYRSTYQDLGDDSGDSAVVSIRMRPASWEALVAHALKTNTPLNDSVAEWVGLHYGRNFDKEGPAKQVEWVERYLDLPEGRSVPRAPKKPIELRVLFEYVYPDEDGGSRTAQLNLDTGILVLDRAVPDDISDPLVRTRIWTGEEVFEGDDYEVVFDDEQSGGVWRLEREDLKELKKHLAAR